MRRFLSLTALAAFLVVPAAARAQVAIPSIPPSVQNNPIIQSVLQAVGGVLLQSTNGPTAHGRVSFFQRFEMQVQTAPNVYRNVHLHQGTVINPRGTTIAPGMTVDASGSSQPDASLNADTITVH